MLVLLHIVAVLSFDGDRASQTKVMDVPPGKIYQLRQIRATGSDPFCLSVVERRDSDPSRATYLGCHKAGEVVANFKEPPLIGGRGVDYVIIVFRPSSEYKPATVVINADIQKEKRP
jgi:hypothetical protein